ncbi:MAG: hypothetical protein HQL05_16015 [Nitrospirae bacterium]|nr:hypothetical protein [Nitrospirota bacterium]
MEKERRLYGFKGVLKQDTRRLIFIGRKLLSDCLYNTMPMITNEDVIRYFKAVASLYGEDDPQATAYRMGIVNHAEALALKEQWTPTHTFTHIEKG